MTYSWRDWEGRTVDGKYVLANYLGGSEITAVFRARAVGSDPSISDVAIRLVPLSGGDAEAQLRRWQQTTELSHPNLLRLLNTGCAVVDGAEVVYAVEELAEENLAQIVPERALTADEARAMLPPVLAALEFLHARRLVHGRVRPSNILAAGDQIKLSIDSLRPAGTIPPKVNAYDAPEILANGVSPASDVWSLGITLVEVLTQRKPVFDPARRKIAEPGLNKNIPEPFRGIAQHCLQVDPSQRPSPHEITTQLESVADQPAQPQAEPKPTAALAEKSTPVDAMAASARKRANGPYWLVLAIAIVVIVFLFVRPRPSTAPADEHTSSASPQTSASQPAPAQSTPPRMSSEERLPASSTQTQEPTQTPPAEPPSAQPPSSASQSSSEAHSEREKKTSDENGTGSEIIERATPQVSASARRTIHGKVKVRVRVEVDAAGNVTEAKLTDAGPSQYFAREALEAARHWKFAAASEETRRSWALLFAFTRGRTEMSAVHAP